jgi:hypothetical protein
MSSKALRKVGISALDDKDFQPTKGVLVRLTPEQFLQVKTGLQPVLAALGDKGFWRAGGAGSFDPEHRFAKKGTNKIDSGDVDVFLDTGMIKKKLKLDPEMDDGAVRKVVAGIMSKKYPMNPIGKNVHIGYPMGKDIDVPGVGPLPAYFQVDLMTMEDAHEIGQHHEHDYSVKDSPYGGQDQQFALASLVNTIPGQPERTYQYNGFGGALQRRDTGEIVTRNIDKIAEIVLGKGATADDLGNVESMIAKVGGIDSPRLAQFRDDMAKKYPQLKEGSIDWFKDIRQKLGL